jgi:TPP-dependent pyruvate/acetoin dehydrogenase alpha subunit
MAVYDDKSVGRETLLDMHRWLVWEKLLDQRVKELFQTGKAMSMYHSSAGQEAANVGAYMALKDGDAFIPSVPAARLPT